MASVAKIPLKCDICPKNPRFSDVSHLLTHISGKSHLANIFKSRVRLETDTECRRLIEDYDQWYAEWNIQDLLAERMSQKENKVAKPKTRGGVRGQSGRRRRSSTAAQNGVPANSRPTIGVPHQHLDPRIFAQPLGQPQINGGYYVAYRGYLRGNMQNNSQNFQPQPAQFLPGHGHFAIPNSGGMYGAVPWQQTQHSGTGTTRVKTSRPASTVGGRKRRAAAVACDTAIKRLRLQDRGTGSQTPGSETVISSDDMAISTPRMPDATTAIPQGSQGQCPQMMLKGIMWPGMGCFDAAFAHQRSQRNQKKTTQAYDLLSQSSIRTSDAPYEVIYRYQDDGEWTTIKSRFITGNPSPSSIVPSSPRQSLSGSPTKSHRRVLRQRHTSQRALIDDDNQREQDLTRGVVEDPGEKMSVLAAEDDSPLFGNAFLRRPYTGGGRLIGAGVQMNQENDRADNDSAAATVKTDFDGTDPGAHVALPSIERGANHPRHAVNEDAAAGPLAHGPVLPPPVQFRYTSPGGNMGPPYDFGSLNSSVARPYGFGQVQQYGYVGSRGYQYSIPRPSLDYSNHQIVAGIDHLVAAAHNAQGYTQSPTFNTSNFPASPANSNHAPMNQFSPSHGSLGSAFQTADWYSPSPIHQSLDYHGRHSSQNWNMLALLPAMPRRFGFADMQGRQIQFMDTKQMYSAAGAQHANHTAQSGGFNAERLAPNYGFGQDHFGFAGSVDNEHHTYLPPIRAPPINGFGFSDVAPPVVPAQAAQVEPTTPDQGLMAPPPLPDSVDYASVRGWRHTCGSGSRAKSQSRRPGNSNRASSAPTSESDLPAAPAATGDTTDEERTVTAPGTPSETT